MCSLRPGEPSGTAGTWICHSSPDPDEPSVEELVSELWASAVWGGPAEDGCLLRGRKDIFAELLGNLIGLISCNTIHSCVPGLLLMLIPQPGTPSTLCPSGKFLVCLQNLAQRVSLPKNFCDSLKTWLQWGFVCLFFCFCFFASPPIKR